MAVNFEKKINDAIQELMKQYKKAAIEAAVAASDEASAYIYQEALTCLQNYYDSYREGIGHPKSYTRTDTLKDSFCPIKTISTKTDEIICSVGVAYDPSMLDGKYYVQHGSNYTSWNPPDSQWIINNYLRGVHPITDGSPEKGTKVDEILGYNPSNRMERVLDLAYSRFESSFFTSLSMKVIKNIK